MMLIIQCSLSCLKFKRIKFTRFFLFALYWDIFKNAFFQLIDEASSCAILERSIDRFKARAFPGKLSSNGRQRKSICRDGVCTPYFSGLLPQVQVSLDNGGCRDTYPHPDMDERCKPLEKMVTCINFTLFLYRPSIGFQRLERKWQGCGQRS